MATRITTEASRSPTAQTADRPLRIGLLSYRSHPNCGGQGVYVRHLSQALHALGHSVEVISGQPYPELVNGLKLHRLPSLDLYNPQNLFRKPALNELRDPINLLEWLDVSTMGFPEPFTFGARAVKFLRPMMHRFDVLHDNQSLSYGIRTLARQIPTVATIHHAMTVDRNLAVRSERMIWNKFKQLRWYSFIAMQKRVAPSLSRIITVSRFAREDIARAFNIGREKFTIAANGIDSRRFHPLPGIERRRCRLIVTSSADTPLKGLKYLLQAMAALIPKWPELHLVVVGTPKKESTIPALIRSLGLGRHVEFTGAISQEQFVRHYAKARAAVVPSLYEGFGLPAGEAMACGVPVISTTGGALPEVVGDAGLLVPPGDAAALASAIDNICRDDSLAAALGSAGRERVLKHFTWKRAAQVCVEVYRRTIAEFHPAGPGHLPSNHCRS
jgi:glycosyltransferase involved in cell wall biosynthesis